MIEDEAKDWMTERFDAATLKTVGDFVSRVAEEGGKQNLVSPSTLATIWSRHVVDSAQLLWLAPADWQTWVDIGTGGGFPGMIVALLEPARQVIMVEPRRKRAEFLTDCLSAFHLKRSIVERARIETLSMRADVISARAVASIDTLLTSGQACADGRTTWLLPRGTVTSSEVQTLQQSGRVFHVEQSVTNSTSSIVVIGGDPA